MPDHVLVLDKGYVKLIDVMGSDLSVANAARASYQKASTEFSEADERLIKFLAREGHMSPFRHAFATFEVYAPLMVARQWWKYCVGSDHTMDGWNEACFWKGQKIQAILPKSRDIQQVTVSSLYEMAKDDLLRGAKLLSLRGGVNSPIFWQEINEVWKAGLKSDVYKVVTDTNNSVVTTLNHRYMSENGEWVHLSDIEVGDKIMTVLGPSKVISKELFASDVDVYDIEMSMYPSIVVDDIIVHNSRRYITSEPEFYIIQPNEWRSAPANSKQGSGAPLPESIGSRLTSRLLEHVDNSISLYEEAMRAGACAEQARVFLPAYDMYVYWRWSSSLQAICHFLNQRLAHDAQVEIQRYAKAVYHLIKDKFPYSIEALVGNHVD